MPIHLTVLIVSKEVEQALTYETSFSPMELLKLVVWFSLIRNRGNRGIRARGPVS